MTLYDVLGMPPSASHADLRRAYLRAARRTHPDVHATADVATRQAAEAQMRTLNEAWAVLRDAQRRRAYDRQLADHQRAAARRAAAPRGAPVAPTGYGRADPAGPGPYGTHARPAGRPAWPTGTPPHRHPTGSASPWTGTGPFVGGRTAPAAGPAATGPHPAGSGPYGTHAAPQADWRRFASPGPAVHRSLAARLATVLPALLVPLAVGLAALGVVMGRSSLLTLAGAVAVAASIGFLAAPVLALKEDRRRARLGRRRAGAGPAQGNRVRA